MTGCGGIDIDIMEQHTMEYLIWPGPSTPKSSDRTEGWGRPRQDGFGARKPPFQPRFSTLASPLIVSYSPATLDPAPQPQEPPAPVEAAAQQLEHVEPPPMDHLAPPPPQSITTLQQVPMPMHHMPQQMQPPMQPTGAYSRPVTKRHWLLSDQVQRIEDAFVRWNGNWRGKEPQLQALATELGIKVEKLKKRVDYMRRSREAKALREQEAQDGMKGLTGDLLDHHGDDSSFLAKRARFGEACFTNRRIRAEPYHPPRCLFSQNGCVSNPEHGQIMTVIATACGHRFVCLDCFNDGFNLDQYLSKIGACPTCRDGPLTSKQNFVILQEIERLQSLCKWCRVKNRNMAFTPCAHISDYCTDCFDQAGSGYYSKEETCTSCEQKFQKVLEI